MQCSKCGKDMTAIDVGIVFGVRGDNVETLIETPVRITTCCGVAFLSDAPKPEPTIILP